MHDFSTPIATPAASRSESQLNLDDYAHVDISTRRIHRHSSRPSSIVQSLTGKDPHHRYPPSNAPPSNRAMLGDVTTLTVAYPAFWPLAPEQVQRYERELVSPNRTDYWIGPLTISFRPDHCHNGWLTYVHPEGARYFIHERKVSPCTGNYHDAMIYSGCLLPRIFTDINIYDPDKLDLITKFMVDMEDYIRAKGINIHPNVDLVFDLRRDPDNGDICCAYYFASHDDRSIFWLDDFNSIYLDRCNEVDGVTEQSHIGHEIEAQYWYHCQLFPTCLEMTEDVIDELRDILIFCLGDIMTSPVPYSSYGEMDLQPMLTLTDTIKESVKTGQRGLPGSAVSCIFSSNNDFTTSMDSLVPGLSAKKKIQGDGLVSNDQWRAFVAKMDTERKDFLLNATVLLNANVAFLAIQSVDESSASAGRSLPQVLSYVSVIGSIGCIVLAVREQQFLYLDLKKSSLESVAIMYSLPWALLMWAMLSFSLAFSLVCFTASDLAVRMGVGSAWLTVGVLILWCIMAPRKSEPWSMLTSAFWKDLRGRLSVRPYLNVVKSFINSDTEGKSSDVTVVSV
ncbi:uncharacterized protein EV420DRAFT_1706647 [Desarmillaria tabescens]|uniref:Uncharacterized protein n=1 Tax=Armillaria tabescens TaxID=1929756 RepID=A0AA39JXM5_ARMTA|nr:uncharacterized protein EV420DRAFT_1706647 [Desarmillaria tabescens]KAK0449715.1 hypothetical protein EV420DRAFT_1706647 [Desarmillaria tabescens]